MASVRLSAENAKARVRFGADPAVCRTAARAASAALQRLAGRNQRRSGGGEILGGSGRGRRRQAELGLGILAGQECRLEVGLRLLQRLGCVANRLLRFRIGRDVGRGCPGVRGSFRLRGQVVLECFEVVGRSSCVGFGRSERLLCRLRLLLRSVSGRGPLLNCSLLGRQCFIGSFFVSDDLCTNRFLLRRDLVGSGLRVRRRLQAIGDALLCRFGCFNGGLVERDVPRRKLLIAIPRRQLAGREGVALDSATAVPLAASTGGRHYPCPRRRRTCRRGGRPRP